MVRNYLVNLIVDLIIKIYTVTEKKLSMMAVDYILDGVRREFANRDLRGE